MSSCALRRISDIAPVLAVAFLACAETPVPPAPRPRPVGIAEDLAALTAPEMEGRGAGTIGQVKAAEYLARRFADIGLEKILPGGHGYLQEFEQPGPIEVDPSTKATVDGVNLRLGVDFEPLLTSSDGDADLPVVFAGHGITAPDLHYDDYAGLDVKDRVVLVFDHEPREQDEHSPFRAPEAFHYRESSYKIVNAKSHGARAILIANDGLHHPGVPDEPVPLHDERSTDPLGIPAVSITTATASKLLGGDAAVVLKDIDDALAQRAPTVAGSAPNRRVLGARVSLHVALKRSRVPGMNVVGAIRGIDPKLASQAIVIGAHYDHLGYGGRHSLAPDAKHVIHPGADDNASGASAELAIAAHFRQKPLRRTLVFCEFAGEELGVLGSSAYVRAPAVRLEDTVTMVNMDMVGRLRDHVIVQGTATSPGFEALVKKEAEAESLKVKLGGDGYGPSDMYPFAPHMPVLFFFTGAHEDYHRPTDTLDKINVAGIDTVARLVEGVLEALDSADEQPRFVAKPAPSPSPGGEHRGYGPYLGTIPDFGESSVQGVLLQGVREGSPAEKAGIQKGDVLIRLGAMDVHNLEEMTYALRERRAGDTVEIVVLRAGKRVSVKATLAERR